ncbi:sigma-70 family RNA polymerase sigma factor [uncultured Gemmiger sp.]|uniref:RNA polymerase sigma factor n=1 Tax=uncultured Gemmiger sp. TaxID=1623490 RepID=UPI0025F62F7D|nr:sigma-70 family RNA polymerase sigma factor [uncultured Gemmiger sp.]
MRAMEELYRTYREDVYRYLCSLTRDPAQAEDLLSETFLKALQGAAAFRGQSSEKTWLFGIARNLWLQSRRRQHPTASYDDLLGLTTEDRLSDHAAARQLLDRVRQLLATRDDRARRVMALRVQGYSFEEIGRQLAISAGSARVIECRTRQWLKQALHQEGLL